MNTKPKKKERQINIPSVEIEKKNIVISYKFLTSMVVSSFLIVIALLYFFRDEVKTLNTSTELTKKDINILETTITKHTEVIENNKENIMGLSFRVQNIEKKLK